MTVLVWCVLNEDTPGRTEDTIMQTRSGSEGLRRGTMPPRERVRPKRIREPDEAAAPEPKKSKKPVKPKGTSKPPKAVEAKPTACQQPDASDEQPNQEVTILQRNTFHGQLRIRVAMRPPGSAQPGCLSWKSVLLTTQAQFDKFIESVNLKSYSMTAGQGGKPITMPMKRAKPRWGEQAVLAVVSGSPFVTHKLSIERRAKGEYWALAKLEDKRSLSAPSGIGSFDACVFDLAEGESLDNVTMRLQGKGDYLVTPCEPLKSGPQWE